VFSGGASVASKDLDFIAQFSIDMNALEKVMGEIGFTRKGKYFYHPGTKFFIDFIPGPLSIGDNPIEDIREIEMETGVVRIISATDSVKDRLAGYYYWQDMQSLEQAVLVAGNNPIDMNSVESWSKKEGNQVEYDEFRRRLANQ